MTDDLELRITKVTPTAPALPDLIADETANFLLYVNDTVINGIRQYCGCDSNKELGGILLGRRLQTGDRHLVEILDFRPLHSSDRGRTHFTFEESTLLSAWSTPLPQGIERIGWFHSHPKLGDPFMSQDDIKLHSGYFPAPWHISCVVATGEWALPMGFWRILDGELITIHSHYVRMSRATAIGEQSRRFLAASRGADVAIDSALAELKVATTELCLANGSPAFEAMRPILEANLHDGADMVSAAGLGTLLKLGVALVEGLRDRVELDRLIERFDRYRDADRCVTTLIQSAHLAGQMIVAGRTCLTLLQGGQDICRGDFDANTVLRLKMRHPSTLVGATLDPVGRLYVAMKDGSLIRFDYFSGSGSKLSGSEVAALKGAIKVSNSRPAKQITMNATHIFALFPSGVFRFELAAAMDGEEATPFAALVVARSEEGDLRLVEGQFSQEGHSLVKQGQALRLLDGWGEELASVRLEPNIAETKLVQACATNTGIALLLRKGEGTIIEVVRADTLQPRFSYHANSESQWARITHVTSDAAGQLFVKTDGRVAQLR